MQKIFVFGTLKQGFPNHQTNSGNRLPGQYKTLHKFPLYLVGERFSPWMINSPGNGHQVLGQVFTVDQKSLAKMDKLERIEEPDGYRRIKLAVVNKQSAEQIEVLVYVKLTEQLKAQNVRLELQGEYQLKHASLYSSRSSKPTPNYTDIVQ